MTMLMPQSTELALLTALQTSTIKVLTVNLFSNNLSPVDEHVIADFTLATFTGYAAITGQNMLGPIYDDAGNVELVSPNCVFVATGSGTANTIYGYLVTDAAVATLYYFELFETPQQIAKAGDAVSFVHRFGYANPGTGAVVTE